MGSWCSIYRVKREVSANLTRPPPLLLGLAKSDIPLRLFRKAILALLFWEGAYYVMPKESGDRPCIIPTISVTCFGWKHKE